MKEQIPVTEEAFQLIGIGILGALVRAINRHPFSFYDAFVRVVTAGFTSGLAYMYLIDTDYTKPLKGVIIGIVGCMGADLLDALKIRLRREIIGKENTENIEEEENNEDNKADS